MSKGRKQKGEIKNERKPNGLKPYKRKPNGHIKRPYKLYTKYFGILEINS
jgi:hypothetical protein